MISYFTKSSSVKRPVGLDHEGNTTAQAESAKLLRKAHLQLRPVPLHGLLTGS